MNENDFRKEYDARQQSIVATKELKEKALARALRRPGATAAPASERHPEAALSSNPRGRRALPHRRTPSATSPRPRVAAAAPARRWALPLAACLVAAALVVGGIPVLTTFSPSGKPSAIALDDATRISGFTVRAYASSDGDTIMPGQGDMIVFDRGLDAGASTGSTLELGSVFTGCLFRVEGEGIARVQMNVSAGELYRQTTERYTQAEEPERFREASLWKPTKRGDGTYYGAYDVVYPLTDLSDDSIPITDPNKPLRVNLMKRYGATVDASVEDDPDIATGETSFGLWTDVDSQPSPEADADGNPVDPYAAALDAFEGQRLTVTVTFEDGSTATQVIELHAADFRAEYENNELMVTSEMVDRSDVANGGGYVRAVYGIVVEASKAAFPLPLEGANEHADEVMPADTLDRLPSTYRATKAIDDSGDQRVDLVLDRNALLHDGDTAQVTTYSEHAGCADMAVGSPRIVRSVTPPEGLSLADFSFNEGFLGDVAYANKCSQQVFGYGFNEDGTLDTEGFCFVTATFELTNRTEGDATVRLSGFTFYAILDDDEGHFSFAHTSYSVQLAASANANMQAHGTCTIAAGDTVTATTTIVLPDWMANSDTLMFLAGYDAAGDPLLFDVASQR